MLRVPIVTAELLAWKETFLIPTITTVLGFPPQRLMSWPRLLIATIRCITTLCFIKFMSEIYVRNTAFNIDPAYT